MSYSSNYNLNQRISYLESIVQQIIPVLPIDLANVLLQGNSAGASDIDLNNQDILQVDNLDVVTINNGAYPPPSLSLNITSTNTNSNFFPVFVSGAGVQTLRCDNATTPFVINPSIGSISLANTLSISGSTTDGQVRLGINAGLTNLLANSIAIGQDAGRTNSGLSTVSIGLRAGTTGQGDNAVALGENAGRINQGANAVAIGLNAGRGNTSGQGANSIAIGNSAGITSQTAGSICLNASGVALNPNQVGCFINPIRAGALGSSFTPALPPTALYYDTTTFEILRAT
jgi:hypothetical protein